MRICHIIPYIGLAQGGPVRSMAEYAEAQALQGDPVSIAAIPLPSDGEPIPISEHIDCLWGAPAFFGSFRYCPDLSRRIAAWQPDLIHSHGLWTYASLAAGTLAQRLRIPHVVAPCGMLQAGALQRSHLKKRLCRLLFQDRMLHRAACVHAKSASEADGIREIGYGGRIETIPNPVPIPADLPQRPRNLGNSRRRTILYLGRLHPVKGIPRLIAAWLALTPRPDSWQLVVAGPDEAGLIPRLQDQLVQAGLADTVTFPGPLEGTAKWSTLTNADLFVMPSDYENFGTAIVEAMRIGLPVITTSGTPWQELQRETAGWWVEPTAEAIAQALTAAMSLSDEQREDMGHRARLIGDAFAPPAVVTELRRLYQSLQC